MMDRRPGCGVSAARAAWMWLPARGKTEVHEVKVAGIYIGKLVVKTIGSWRVLSDQENG